jgi:beta-lactamase superfamily II metal-dependent hydrolase
MIEEAKQLGAAELALAKELGNRKKVTTPNLASLMFLAEEQGQKILLTGDGHWEDIIKGLEHHQAFDGNDKLHVDVLKVQHHGAEHNIAKGFCERVTADRYVFCGNGEHANPDLDVLDLIFNHMNNDQRSFALLFNSSSTEREC